jgi:SAM-dependent methyltransferase
MFETHMIEGDLWKRWIHDLRRFEFERLMENVPMGPATTVLELGCGDGFQLDLLRKRFDRVYAIDPEHSPAAAQGFAFSTAEALPFPDGAFDLVTSCAVMEHLADRAQGIEGIVRVLRPGGYMAHIVPGPYWKSTNVLFNPLGYPLHVLGKWSTQSGPSATKRESERSGPKPGNRPGLMKVLRKCIYPEIHGTYPSHWAEFRDYRRERWRHLFAHPKLVRVAEVPLVCYSAFGFLRFHLLPIRAWMARHGLSSCYGFILRKVK